jgi:hypothetical protein
MTPNDDIAPWSLWEGPVAQGEVATYCALRAAVLHREEVLALHNGAFLSFCPLVLGVRHGRRVVLAYLIVAEAEAAPLHETANLPPRCRALAVEELQVVKTSRGLWPLSVGPELLLVELHVDVQAIW